MRFLSRGIGTLDPSKLRESTPFGEGVGGCGRGSPSSWARRPPRMAAGVCSVARGAGWLGGRVTARRGRFKRDEPLRMARLHRWIARNLSMRAQAQIGNSSIFED